MKTCRAILNRYFVKDGKTYVVAYALNAERQLVSKILLVPEGLRIGGYIKSAKPMTITTDGDKLVSVMSDAELTILKTLLADLEKPADSEKVKATDSPASLAELLEGKEV